MALIETTRDVNGTNITFIEVSATEGILKDGLSARDITALTDVDTNGTGADLKAKMDGYALSNGRDALETYSQNIFDMDAYAALRLKGALTGTALSQTISDHQATLDDHEARITALEP